MLYKKLLGEYTAEQVYSALIGGFVIEMKEIRYIYYGDNP